jgi:Ca2+-binding EF-hand superfamily protein
MKRPTYCHRNALTLVALVAGGSVLSAAAQEPPATSAHQEPAQQEPMTREESSTQSAEATDATRADPIAVVELSIMDVDGDGAISAREHESGSKKVFENMDGNHDGEVTAAEMQSSGLSTSTAGNPTAASEPAEARIAAVDRDSDGKLTADEHAAASQEIFGRLDGDRDGSLSQNEIQMGRDMTSTPRSDEQQ